MNHEFPWYHESVEVLHKCVMCTGPVWPHPHYICRTCHWENDVWAYDYPEDPYNANGISFAEAFVNWNLYRNIWGKDTRFAEIMALIRTDPLLFPPA